MDIIEEDWQGNMDMNSKGVPIGTRVASNQFTKQGSGDTIFNTPSIALKRGYPHFSHFCASIFAMAALTQAVARALGEPKITVYAFGPNEEKTELPEQLDPEFIQHSQTKNENKAFDGILIGRPDIPARIAGTTTFVASSASDKKLVKPS